MFEYDRSLIMQVKDIIGRRWNSIYRQWEVPYSEENLGKLEGLGFDVNDIRTEAKAKEVEQMEVWNQLHSEIHTSYDFLYDFQVDAVVKGIINGNLLIADSMGLGKTLESFTIGHYRLKQKHVERIVIFCPTSIKHQWKDEIIMRYGIQAHIVKGTPEEREAIYRKEPTIMICNYEQLLRDFWKLNTLIHNQLVILDEASYLKNPEAKRTKLVKQLTPKYTIANTGTPIENKLMDVFSIGNIIQPNWMNRQEFYSYCIYERKFGFNNLIGYKNINKFMKRLMEISIRRKWNDINLHVPEKIIEERSVALTPYQKSLEEKLVMNLRENIHNKGMLHEFVLLPMLEDSTELLQLSNAPSLRSLKSEGIRIESSKVSELDRILEEIDDDKMVIFTRFKKMANILFNRYRDKAVLGTGDADKQNVLNEFKNNKERRYLIATEAFAYGVDMPYASCVINFDIPWNPARLKQRIDRCYRVSSKKRLLVINMISEGLERYIYNVMNKKEALFQEVTAFNVNEQLLTFINSSCS